MHDLTSALQANPAAVISEILTLKQDAQKLIHQCLLDHCRSQLLELGVGNERSGREVLKELTVLAESLVEINRKETKSHIVYVDVLTARGKRSFEELGDGFSVCVSSSIYLEGGSSVAW